MLEANRAGSASQRIQRFCAEPGNLQGALDETSTSSVRVAGLDAQRQRFSARRRLSPGALQRTYRFNGPVPISVSWSGSIALLEQKYAKRFEQKEQSKQREKV